MTLLDGTAAHSAIHLSSPPDLYQLTPLSDIMGAEIEHIDLSIPVSDEAFTKISADFLKHKVLVFRNQKLSKDQIHSFAARFGPIEGHTVFGANGNFLEGVHDISNLDADGQPSKKPHINANYYWHSDKAHYKAPSLLTMLYAVELPPGGSETEFADTEAAYDALGNDMKDRIKKLIVENDFAYAMKNVGKDLSEKERLASLSAVHPIVRIHPETRRKGLFVGMYSKGILGIPDGEAQALIKTLIDSTTQPKFIFRQQWRLNDLVVWDNRCLLHRAVMNLKMAQHRRVLWRCVVRGAPSI